MATARKKPARRVKRANPKKRPVHRAIRRNPTTYAGGFRAPFNRLTARDWAHIRETAAALEAEFGYGEESEEEIIMTSQGYVSVHYSPGGAWVKANGLYLDEPEWPSAPRRRATAKRSKRAAGSKRTRKVNQRSNPRRKPARKARRRSR